MLISVSYIKRMCVWLLHYTYLFKLRCNLYIYIHAFIDNLHLICVHSDPIVFWAGVTEILKNSYKIINIAPPYHYNSCPLGHEFSTFFRCWPYLVEQNAPLFFQFRQSSFLSVLSPWGNGCSRHNLKENNL